MIFLSYASEDRERVLPYYDLLNNHGLDPWMDCKKILGGQNWDYEIKIALDRSEIVVVFVSEKSIDKRGYVQREIRLAIDKYQEKITGDIYLIPVQLDSADFPHVLQGIHFIKVSDGNVDEMLLNSIEAALHSAKEKTEVAQTEAEVRWNISEIKSSYSGIPGYSTTINKISISSAKYASVSEISDHINGVLAELSMNARGNSLTPDPNNYNLLQNEWRRTDTFDGIFASSQVIGRVISITYLLHWYAAGAVHPVHAPRTFNYLLEPIYYLKNIKDLFLDDAALNVLKSESERELAGADTSLADIDWIRRGTSSWEDFSNFSFEPGGISFQFSSYQVACYAAGMPSVSISYSKLTQHFRDTILYALNLYRSS